MTLGLLQCLSDACVFRLTAERSIAMTIVVHVDDIFAVGERKVVTSSGWT